MALGTHMYVFEGIDLQKTIDDALGPKSTESAVVVHYHGKPRSCGDFRHRSFYKGVQVDDWGTVDGSTYPARSEGQ